MCVHLRTYKWKFKTTFSERSWPRKKKLMARKNLLRGNKSIAPRWASLDLQRKDILPLFFRQKRQTMYCTEAPWAWDVQSAHENAERVLVIFRASEVEPAELLRLHLHREPEQVRRRGSAYARKQAWGSQSQYRAANAFAGLRAMVLPVGNRENK